jgi:hypothetical protein
MTSFHEMKARIQQELIELIESNVRHGREEDGMNTRTIFLLVAMTTLAIPEPSLAQVPVFAWARHGGGSGQDQASDVAVDGEGNAWLYGSFFGDAQFENVTLSSSNFQIFVAKYDVDGDLLLARQSTGDAGIFKSGVTVDNVGNAFITGDFLGGTLTFDAVTLTSQATDVFLVKYDPTGIAQWGHALGGTAHDFLGDVATDTDGNVIVTGVFQESATFGGDSLTSANAEAIFIAKFDTNGTALWARKIDKNDFDVSFGPSVASDAVGNVVIAGQFRVSLDFGSTVLMTSDALDFVDVFVAKYDGNGNFMWARKAGGPNTDTARDVATDAGGNVIAVGSFSSDITFSPVTLSATGVQDGFVAKYDPNGGVLWARQSEGADLTAPAAVAIDPTGLLTVGGSFRGSTVFGADTLTSVDSIDGFLVRYSPNGLVIATLLLGGTLGDQVTGVAVDAFRASLVVGGSFAGQIELRGPPTLSFGSTDAYITRIEERAATAVGESVGSPTLILGSYPNPFSSSASVSFSIDGPQNVTVTIHDVTGRLVARLTTDTGYHRGSHTLNWSGRDTEGRRVAAGVFFVRLQTQRSVAITRILKIN